MLTHILYMAETVIDVKQGFIMKSKKRIFFLAAVLVFLLVAGIGFFCFRAGQMTLVIENLESGEIYVKTRVKPGDELSFGWEHSFEHIPWNEYYEIKADGTFLLHTISVAGFGAGIPAEMDCTYRYEDGLIYMDDIESEFPRFNWFNSQTQLKFINLNGNLLITGADMPQHEKIVLRVK